MFGTKSTTAIVDDVVDSAPVQPEVNPFAGMTMLDLSKLEQRTLLKRNNIQDSLTDAEDEINLAKKCLHEAESIDAATDALRDWKRHEARAARQRAAVNPLNDELKAIRARMAEVLAGEQ